MNRIARILALLVTVVALGRTFYLVSKQAPGRPSTVVALPVSGRVVTASEEVQHALRVETSALKRRDNSRRHAVNEKPLSLTPSEVREGSGELWTWEPSRAGVPESNERLSFPANDQSFNPEIEPEKDLSLPVQTHDILSLLSAASPARERTPMIPAAQAKARSSTDGNAGRGEFGTDLGFLKKFYTPPQTPDESNHYIDLWSGDTLPALARANGLTNNHALFLDSHGKGGCGFWGNRYVFYPSDELAPKTEKAPHFSARDVAAIIGPVNAGKIHNIVLAGCNLDGAFNAQEFRKFFVNATNVTHTAAGHLGFKPMFYQAIFKNSDEIKTLYANKSQQRIGGTDYEIVDAPRPGATVLSPYVAELFMPGARKPFRVTMAGRELLAPVRFFSKPAPLPALFQSRNSEPIGPAAQP